MFNDQIGKVYVNKITRADYTLISVAGLLPTLTQIMVVRPVNYGDDLAYHQCRFTSEFVLKEGQDKND